MKITMLVLLLSFCSVGTLPADDEKNAGKDLKGKQYKGASLNRADFSDANLTDASFDGANLKKANFKDAIIRTTDFSRADLTGADMRGTVVHWAYGGDETNFNDSNWEGSTLGGARKSTFRGTNLQKAKLLGSLIDNDFTGADLRGANLLLATIVSNPNAGNVWKKAKYDDDTAFPKGFDPKEEGMILTKPEVKKEDKK